MRWLERLDRWMFPREEQAIDRMAVWGRGDLLGTESFSGMDVNQETALRFGVVWRCIRLISETLAGLPQSAIRKRDAIREPVDRPAAWLDNPNPETNDFEFRERVFESLLMDGNAFILITARDQMAFPSELWTLHPRSIEVKSRGNRTYFLWNGDTELSRFGPDNPAGEVLHIKLATAGGLRGLSPIEAARQGIGLGMVAEKFGAKFFGSGQQMSGVIQLPADQPARSKEHIDLMREQWEAAHAGSDRAHRPAILTGGATWEGVTIPPEDAQFLQTRTFQVEDICRFYGVPPVWVGLTEKQTSWGTGVEQQSIGLYRYTLRGHIVRFETAMSQLLPRGQYVRLEPQALTEADAKTQADILNQRLFNGSINRNEVRALYDDPPIPGGDRYMVPMNMAVLTAGGLPEPKPEPPPPPTEPSGDQLPQEVPDGKA